MRARLFATLAVSVLAALLAIPSGTVSASSSGNAVVSSTGDIRFVANIPYPVGTDEEFATFNVTKLSNGATGDPVCQTNPDGSCATDAAGKIVYQTEDRDFAFVGSESVNGFVIDITDPENPVSVASLPCRASQNDIQIWHNILLQSQDGTGGTCHKPSGGTQTQVTIGFSDISDPRNPRFLGKLTEARGAHNATVHPTQPIVYISNSDLPSTSDVIHIWDFSNPAAPVKVKDWNPTSGSVFSPHDITFNASGTRAYVASVDHTEILDSTDPKNPTLISTIYNEGVSISHQSDPTPDGKFLLVSDELGGGGAPTVSPGGSVHVYDIRNELRPVKVGLINEDLTGAGHVSTAHVFRINPDGRTMAIAWYQDGVHVFDFSDIHGPNLYGSGNATGVGARTIASILMQNANTWSAKMWQDRHPGYVFANDINRGFDVFYVPELGPGFLSTGTIHAPIADGQAPSLTEIEFQTRCEYSPVSQGLDGYVFDLRGTGDGNHTNSVKGTSAAAHNLDLTFYDAACKLLTGKNLTAGNDPSGTIPAGAKYAVADLVGGAQTRFVATTAVAA
ncbi:MAG: LVIVD repeat-containing protein [Actinomycetota bacterium]